MADRRLTGEGSIYQRGSDGRWVGVVDLGWVGGRRVRRTVTAQTLAQLRPKYKRLKREVEAGIDPDAMTVEQWMTRWLDTIVVLNNRPSTTATYRGYVKKWVIPYLGKIRLDKLRGEHIEVMYDAMSDAGLSDATRRQTHAILRRALKVAVQRRKISVNPAEHVTPPPVGQGSHGKLTLVEARTILTTIAHDPLRSRWTCALLAGLRQGEALGLRWEKVDFERDLIVIDQAAQQVPGESLRIVPLKSAASYRAIPMVAPVRAALWEERQESGYVWGGDRLTGPKKDWEAWKDLLAARDIPPRPLHAARATTASLLSDAGVPDKIIAEIMGHSQVAVTQKHYIHGDDATRRNAMEKLEELIQ